MGLGRAQMLCCRSPLPHNIQHTPVNIVVLGRYRPYVGITAGTVPAQYSLAGTKVMGICRFAHRFFTGPVL